MFDIAYFFTKEQPLKHQIEEHTFKEVTIDKLLNEHV